MPELPEVQTTVNGLRVKIVGHIISDTWSDYDSKYWGKSDNIKNTAYFKIFKKEIIGKKVLSVDRRAKNILINLEDNLTILVHMKMTGHLLYGTYHFNTKAKKDPWQPIEPESLKDPYNRRVHFLLSFDNGKHLALSDLRKFAKVTLVHTDVLHVSEHLDGIGPEPLDPEFTYDKFVERLNKRPNGKVKQVLLDQTIIAGIGNIYADESLFRAGIHPLQKIVEIPKKKMKELYEAIQKTLSRGIDFGGDSTSDYRDVDGNKGQFQEHHSAYRRTGKKCERKGCKGTITRISLGGRGTHFCNIHQKLDTKRKGR